MLCPQNALDTHFCLFPITLCLSNMIYFGYFDSHSIIPHFPNFTGSALSNASALWSLIAVLISIILRRTFPGGVLANDYENKNKMRSKKGTTSGSGGGSGGSGRERSYKPSLVVPVSEVMGEGEEYRGGGGGGGSGIRGGGSDGMSGGGEGQYEMVPMETAVPCDSGDVAPGGDAAGDKLGLSVKPSAATLVGGNNNSSSFMGGAVGGCMGGEQKDNQNVCSAGGGTALGTAGEQGRQPAGGGEGEKEGEQEQGPEVEEQDGCCTMFWDECQC